MFDSGKVADVLRTVFRVALTQDGQYDGRHYNQNLVFEVFGVLRPHTSIPWIVF